MPKAVPARNGQPLDGLPRPLDRFVGREWELGELRQLLGRSRLLTLLGPVGSGKTRLAIELVDRHLPGTVEPRFADFGSPTDPELLCQTVADALRVPRRPGETLIDAVATALDGQQVLLVLDSCEHVVEPCARVLESLLRRCPGLRVLATSQEWLRVPGEVTFGVGPMSLPRPDDTGVPPALRSDAVRLFLERARERVPDFDVTPANSAAVTGICATLDGMPLAIELAARWVRLLPVQELLAQLNDRFDLLTVAPRTVASRHSGLRAAIRSSVELLEADERAVFRRMSVFAGGFDLAGVTAVCADSGLPRSAVLKAVSGLEAKSLVAAAGTSRRAARFTQLESVRMYGLEQLREADEVEAVHDRLADWLTGLLEPLPERVFATPETLRRLDEEHDNLLQAAQWAAGRGDDRHVLLAATAARCQWERGQPAEARKLLAPALDRVSAEPRHRSAALQQLAWLECWEERGREALAPAEEAVGIERTLDRPSMLGEALAVLALAQLSVGEFAAACSSLEECLDVVRAPEGSRTTLRWLHNLAWTTLRAGDPARAALLLEETLPAVLAGVDPALQAAVLHTVGALELKRGDARSAEGWFREALQSGPPDPYETPRALEGLAITAGLAGRDERALRLASAAAALRRTRTEPDPVWRRSVNLSAGEARQRLGPPRAEAATAAGSRLPGEHAVAYALNDAWSEPGPGDTGHGLSERECAVARLVAEGMTNRGIAARLAVSPRTVDAHLQHIRDKLGLRSRAQVAVWAAEQLAAPLATGPAPASVSASPTSGHGRLASADGARGLTTDVPGP